MAKGARFLFLGFILVVIIALLPFGMLLGPKVLRDYINRELAHKVITEKITKDLKTDEEKAIRLFNYVCTHIFKVTGVYAVNEFPLNDIVRGTAYCDQQANSLLWLARKAGIKGRLIFLRGYDSVSHHSVCDLYIDGRYRIFDPYYDFVFFNDEGKIATFNEIQNGYQDLRSDGLEALRLYSKFKLNNYFRLYEPAHEATFKTKDLKRILVSGFISLYYDIFGDPYVTMFQEFYFRLYDIQPFFRARFKHAAFRLKEAIADYNIVLDGQDSSELLKGDAAYFRAQAVWDKGDYNRAVMEFNKFLEEYPKSRWHAAAWFYLGNSYEMLKDFNKAKSFYLKATRPGKTNLLRLEQEERW